MWWQIFQLVASLVISYALSPKAQPPKPTAFEDIEFPQADEGTPQPVFFGDVWTSSWTIVGLGNYRTTPIKSDGSKKG